MKKRDGCHTFSKRYDQKINFKMKFLSFFILFQLSATTALSQKKIQLNYENVPLKQVLGEIKSQTGYSFFYNVKEIDDTKKISFVAKDETINKV